MHLELHANAANRASFPDCQIDSFLASERQISFHSDGIFVNDVGFIGPDADVHCVISGFVHLREYNDGEWTDIQVNGSSGLREILEWNADNDILDFAGFDLASNIWVEYSITSFSMTMRISHE